MATVSANIATILAQAEVLDGLVEDFLAAKALIDAAELEIRAAQPSANHPAIAGRIRLAEYAIARIRDQTANGGRTVEALATAAWAGVS